MGNRASQSEVSGSGSGSFHNPRHRSRLQKEQLKQLKQQQRQQLQMQLMQRQQQHQQQQQPQQQQQQLPQQGRVSARVSSAAFRFQQQQALQQQAMAQQMHHMQQLAGTQIREGDMVGDLHHAPTVGMGEGEVPMRRMSLKKAEANAGVLWSPPDPTAVHPSIVEIGGIPRLRQLMYCFYTEFNFEKLVAGEVNVEEKLEHVCSFGLSYLNAKLSKKYAKNLSDLGLDMVADGLQTAKNADDAEVEDPEAAARTAGLVGGPSLVSMPSASAAAGRGVPAQSQGAEDKADIATHVWSEGLRLELELYFLEHDPRGLREPQFNALMTYVDECGMLKFDKKLFKQYGKSLNYGLGEAPNALPPSFLSSGFRDSYYNVIVLLLRDFYTEVEPRRLEKKEIDLIFLADWIMRNGIPRVNSRLMVKYGRDLTVFLLETPFWERRRIVQQQSRHRQSVPSTTTASLQTASSKFKKKKNYNTMGSLAAPSLPGTRGRKMSRPFYGTTPNHGRAGAGAGGVARDDGAEVGNLETEKTDKAKRRSSDGASRQKNGRRRSQQSESGEVLRQPAGKDNNNDYGGIGGARNRKDNSGDNGSSSNRKRTGKGKDKYAAFRVSRGHQNVGPKSDVELKHEIDVFLMRHDPVGVLDGVEEKMYKFGLAYGRQELNKQLKLCYSKTLSDPAVPQASAAASGAGMGSFASMAPSSRSPTRAQTEREGGNGGSRTKGGAAPAQGEFGAILKRDQSKYAMLLGKENLTRAELDFVNAWKRLANDEALQGNIEDEV